MAISTVVEGALVAHRSRPYDMTDRGGTKGISRSVFVIPGFDQEPVEVKVGDPDLFVKLTGGGPGSAVRLQCTVYARNDRTQLVLDQVLPVEARKVG
jgi:hypothetical protein